MSATSSAAGPARAAAASTASATVAGLAVRHAAQQGERLGAAGALAVAEPVAVQQQQRVRRERQLDRGVRLLAPGLQPEREAGRHVEDLRAAGAEQQRRRVPGRGRRRAATAPGAPRAR